MNDEARVQPFWSDEIKISKYIIVCLSNLHL